MADTKIFKSLKKKVKLQDFGSRRIKQFPIDCTPLFFQKNILIKGFFGAPRAPKKFKILINEMNRVMCIRQGIFQDQIQADQFKLEPMPLLPSDRPPIKEK